MSERETGAAGRPEEVGRHYDEQAFDFESSRLDIRNPVEYAVTARQLARWVSDGALVADVGVGVGHYAEALARRGCRLLLADVSRRLLDATTERLTAVGLADQIVSATVASATELTHIEDGSLDAVLMLGPLYHLVEPNDRDQAVREARRVLRPGGVFLAAAINQLAFLRDFYQTAPKAIVQERAFVAQFLRDGNVDPTHAPPLGYAHLSTVDEFRALCGAEFEELALLGVESFVGAGEDGFAELPDDVQSAWIDVAEETASTPDGRARAAHFLFVGRRR